MVKKTDPPKTFHSDAKFNFKVFKTKNMTQKRPPKNYIRQL